MTPSVTNSEARALATVSSLPGRRISHRTRFQVQTHRQVNAKLLRRDRCLTHTRAARVNGLLNNRGVMVFYSRRPTRVAMSIDLKR